MKEHPLATTWSAYLDDVLAPSRRASVERHLADCPACRADLDAHRALRHRLDRLAETTPIRADDVVAERAWRAVRPRLGRRWTVLVRPVHRLVYGLGSTAALVLLVLGLAALFSQQAGPATSGLQSLPETTTVVKTRTALPPSPAPNLAAEAQPAATPISDGEHFSTAEPWCAIKKHCHDDGVMSIQEPVLIWEGYLEKGTWQVDPGEGGDPGETVCKSLILGADGQAEMGFCGAPTTSAHLYQDTWPEILDRFAPFESETPEGKIVFRGRGEIASPAWRRAISIWARYTYMELSTAHVCAACRTALAWRWELPEQSRCAMLVVLNYGYAHSYTAPCEGEQIQSQERQNFVAGWLTTEELEQFDAWLYGMTPYYHQGDGSGGYLSGLALQGEMSEDEVPELLRWTETVYAGLASEAAPTPASPRQITPTPWDTLPSGPWPSITPTPWEATSRPTPAPPGQATPTPWLTPTPGSWPSVTPTLWEATSRPTPAPPGQATPTPWPTPTPGSWPSVTPTPWEATSGPTPALS